MTDLSRVAFLESMVKDLPISALYRWDGDLIHTFSQSKDWETYQVPLQSVIAETAQSLASVYRCIATASEGTSVMVHAVALKFEDIPHVMVSLFTMSAIEHYQHDAQLLDVAIEMIEEAVLITDAKNNIVHVNGALEKLTGYTLSELQGKNPSFLSSGNTSAKTYNEMWSSMLSAGQWSGEVWDRRKDGSTYPKWLRLTAVRNGQDLVVNYIGIFIDRSKEKEAEKIIDTMAYYDALTQLPNRNYIKEHLALMVASADHDHQKLALLLVDLDRFKLINDSFGHTAGDRLIMELASRIRSTVRKNDVVARLGGDEFLVVLPIVETTADVIEVAEKILEVFSHPCVIEGIELYTSASIGISFFPSDGETIDAVIQHAEQAMYMAKKRGGKCYELFNSALNDTTLRRLMIENDLHRAIGQNEFKLAYQPQIDTISGKIIGVEALIRWKHSEHGFISPVEFIPIAEESGFILELGIWVMREALGALKRWIESGLEPIRMALNVSARQFAHPDFIGVVQKIIAEFDIPAYLVELEVTESAVMDEPQRAIQICKELRYHGVEFAIDDFGTGYSSLAYLKLFPVKRLKIDKSFVDDIGVNDEGSTLAEVIITLANSLNLEVVAEGVETLEQLQFLRERGCDIIQGYYYSPPKDEVTIISYLVTSPFETINPIYPIVNEEGLESL